jgi:phosphopantothenoylcysteine decarboxylase/phosphopantothenate--cysteine ligase
LVVAANRRILLIVSGGIAAYKVLEVIRRGGERGLGFPAILTRGGAEFVTPLSIASLSGEKVYQDLFSLTDESEMGHIRLSREADLVLVAPASADLLAKMAAGLADDLATTALLATDKPVLAAPAMNVMMWRHPATQANIAKLKERGVRFVGPASGDLACGEEGEGRMAEPADILEAVLQALAPAARPLSGVRALVTSGPTFEAIDPVRYVANHSSGRQGHAIAEALAALGAETILVSGPTALADPTGAQMRPVIDARQMLDEVKKAVPVDVAVCAAAVADWRPAEAHRRKIKKKSGEDAIDLKLVAYPDILATISARGTKRPRLVIGFAAETERIVENGKSKRLRKGCDWILANDVSPAKGTFGGAVNQVHLITSNGTENWPEMSKRDLARRLADRIALALKPKTAKGRGG